MQELKQVREFVESREVNASVKYFKGEKKINMLCPKTNISLSVSDVSVVEFDKGNITRTTRQLSDMTAEELVKLIFKQME